MKKLSLILFLILGINSINAECSYSGMFFLPSSKEISLNSMFIIEGYESSQKTINSFRNRKIYLKSSSGELIELKLLHIYKGQFYLTQAIFKPIQKLKPNTTYTLKYSNQTEDELFEMKRYNSITKKREIVSWKTTTLDSSAPLNPNMKIEFKKTEVHHYGCGPSANAVFNVKNKSEQEIWYKAEVVEIDTNKKTTYYIKEWENKLEVGHGMCSGAFTFKKKGKYKVRFTPMNIDGLPLKTTKWIIFDSPYKDAENPFIF
ncbi:MAG: hypothetical protein KGV44_00600 [Flavobacteriaceae bacterium]|nr:hypothetical protein [Flavobacteriaceae bacterium]